MLPSPVELPVVGVSFRNGYPDNVFRLQTGIEQDHAYQVDLKRELGNQYDKHAIRVEIGGKHFGYLAKPMAKMFSKEFRQGKKWIARVAEVKIDPSNPNNPGLWIRAERIT